MADRFERATLTADRSAALATMKRLGLVRPESAVDGDGQPVVRRPRKTVAELQAKMQATASRWRGSDRRGRS